MRAITPLPNILVLFDCLVDIHVKRVVDSVASGVGRGYMEAAIRGRQILDVSFALSQHIEKALDDHSQGCIATADIAAFFDNLDPLKVCRWLQANGLPSSLCGALLRLHVLPRCCLSVSGVPGNLIARTCGFLTGTRTAGTSARIPLLDAALHRLDLWNQLSVSYNGTNFSVTSFVDNVFAASRNVVDATAVLEDLEDFLRQRWHLTFGDDSREILLAEGLDIDDDEGHIQSRWAIKSPLRCLGHMLTSNGSIDVDFECVRKGMWACFWANFRPSLRSSSFTVKTRLLTTSVAAIGRFRWSRWPWQVTYAKKLDQIQTHMISLLFPVHHLEHGTVDEFFRRRSLAAGRLATKVGRWSSMWAASVRSWHDHVARAHDANTWSPYIYNHHARDWLAERRVQNSRSGELNRTNTRLKRAKVCRRFFEGHSEALNIPPPKPVADKALRRLSDPIAESI